MTVKFKAVVIDNQNEKFTRDIKEITSILQPYYRDIAEFTAILQRYYRDINF